MSFGAPLWLLALIPVLLAALLLRPREAGGVAVRRAGGDANGARAARTPRTAGASRLPWALRAAAAVALVLALAQPHGGADDAGPTVLVLDRSASTDAAMTARERAWVREAITQHACATPCRVVEFAATAAFAGIPATGALAAAPRLGSDATDLAAALRLAVGALPGGGRAVVLSDGFDTTAGALTAASQAGATPPADALTAAAGAARRAGVRVDAVPLAGTVATAAPAAAASAPAAATPRSAAPRRDAAVTRLNVPSPLRAGDPLTLQATVRSTVAGPATLVLSRDGAEIGREAIRLRGGDDPLLLTYRAPAAGWHAYRLAIELPGDADAVNDALDATTLIGAPPRALVIEGAPGRAGELPALLRRDGVEVSTTTAAQPPADDAIAAADAIVLADVPARALGTPTVQALQRAVREQGCGLLLLGGEHSLSLGGYAGTDLDAMLPVQSLQPGGVRRRQLALQLVLDRSSSMNDLAGGLDPKVAMARAAARSALALTARDEQELGVVAFDAVAHELVPLERTTAANAGAIGQLIDGLDADGGTNVLRGLQRGAEQLAASRAAVRHLLLLSDGISEPADYAPLLARLRRERITLSTVALGQDADAALMRRLARAAGGRFYAVPDARGLPRVFAQETRRSAPSVGVRATLPVTAAAASPLVAGLAGRALPPLRGTVLTRLRDGALAPLTTAVNGRAAPVLAQWQYGLGRVVVWTPGAGAWAGDWLSAQPAPFSAAARWSARAVATPPLQPSLSPADPATVVVDPLATAGRTLDLADVTGSARAPDGSETPLAFTQVAPSRYVARLPGEPQPGVHAVTVSADGGAATDALLAVPYPAEHLLQPADASRLGTFTSATGGRLLDAGDPSAALRPSAGTALWRIPLVAAIALLLAAVAIERRVRTRR